MRIVILLGCGSLMTTEMPQNGENSYSGSNVDRSGTEKMTEGLSGGTYGSYLPPRRPMAIQAQPLPVDNPFARSREMFELAFSALITHFHSTMLETTLVHGRYLR